jgi:hypothetical protein
MEAEKPKLADDLLVGAKPIADYLGVPVRRVFYWAESRKLPVFKVGNLWAAKRSTLARHFEKLEAGEVI